MSSLGNGNHVLDNTNRVQKIIYRFNAYKRFFQFAVQNKVPLRELILTQFPFVFSDASKPAMVTVELTNHCNLKCVYCDSKLVLRPKGYMSSNTFFNIMKSIEDSGINRVRLVGAGEPTLHPEFRSFANKLSKKVKLWQIVTNGQWANDSIPSILLQAPNNIIEISVDAGGRDQYQRSRGGSLEKLQVNLIKLRKLKRKLKVNSLINIRLMIRPSQKSIEKEELKYWTQFADTVMLQYVSRIRNMGYYDDVYFPLQQCTQAYPKCALIFKDIEVRWNGEVPLCGPSIHQMAPHGLILGNINEESIDDLWNSKTMHQYREGHRNREMDLIAICRGCVGY